MFKIQRKHLYVQLGHKVSDSLEIGSWDLVIHRN